MVPSILLAGKEILTSPSVEPLVLTSNTNTASRAARYWGAPGVMWEMFTSNVPRTFSFGVAMDSVNPLATHLSGME